MAIHYAGRATATTLVEGARVRPDADASLAEYFAARTTATPGTPGHWSGLMGQYDVMDMDRRVALIRASR